MPKTASDLIKATPLSTLGQEIIDILYTHYEHFGIHYSAHQSSYLSHAQHKALKDDKIFREHVYILAGTLFADGEKEAKIRFDADYSILTTGTIPSTTDSIEGFADHLLQRLTTEETPLLTAKEHHYFYLYKNIIFDVPCFEEMESAKKHTIERYLSTERATFYPSLIPSLKRVYSPSFVSPIPFIVSEQCGFLIRTADTFTFSLQEHEIFWEQYDRLFDENFYDANTGVTGKEIIAWMQRDHFNAQAASHSNTPAPIDPLPPTNNGMIDALHSSLKQVQTHADALQAIKPASPSPTPPSPSFLHVAMVQRGTAISDGLTH